MVTWLLALPSRLNVWLGVALGAVVTVLGAYAAGDRARARKTRERAAHSRLKHFKSSQGIKADVKNMDDDDRAAELERMLSRDD